MVCHSVRCPKNEWIVILSDVRRCGRSRKPALSGDRARRRTIVVERGSAVVPEKLRIASFRQSSLRPASRSPPRLALNLPCPRKKAQQLPPRSPDERKDARRSQCIGPLAGIGLDPPAQIIASPRREPVASSCIPDKAQRLKHSLFPLALEYNCVTRIGPVGVNAED